MGFGAVVKSVYKVKSSEIQYKNYKTSKGNRFRDRGWTAPEMKDMSTVISTRRVIY